MTLRNFPPADQCTPEDIDNLADLVVRDPRVSYDLAGSREHIEALCRRYQVLMQERDAARWADETRSKACEAALAQRDATRASARAMERALADATNDLDAARTEIRALAETLDAERNERQGEVLAAEADRERADAAEALVEVYEAIARAALAVATRTAPVDLAELVHAVNGRLSRALVRERQLGAAFSAKLEDALLHLEGGQLDRAFADATRKITGRSIETVNIQLDAELAAHPDPGPLHHARDMRDQEDTTP
jgi:vacuolar-type H+-ATPase subunit I/STV1